MNSKKQGKPSRDFPEIEKIQGTLCGRRQKESNSSPIGFFGSSTGKAPGVDVELDFNSQPTMIAYKSDAFIDEPDSVEDDVVEVDDCRRDADDGLTVDEDGQESHRWVEFNSGLSKLVDLNPNNKGRLTDKKDCSSEAINEAFKQYREEIRFVSFKELVSSEVVRFGINQSIFAKTVLRRSQGYLSDLLNHQRAIVNMKEPSRMLTNFVKIKAFLDLDELERRSRYLTCVTESFDEGSRTEPKIQTKISRRKRRMTFTKDVKEELQTIFRDRITIPAPNELSEISYRLGLEIATIKNFFRNFRARSKIS